MTIEARRPSLVAAMRQLARVPLKRLRLVCLVCTPEDVRLLDRVDAAKLFAADDLADIASAVRREPDRPGHVVVVAVSDVFGVVVSSMPTGAAKPSPPPSPFTP